MCSSVVATALGRWDAAIQWWLSSLVVFLVVVGAIIFWVFPTSTFALAWHSANATFVWAVQAVFGSCCINSVSTAIDQRVGRLQRDVLQQPVQVQVRLRGWAVCDAVRGVCRCWWVRGVMVLLAIFFSIW